MEGGECFAGGVCFGGWVAKTAWWHGCDFGGVLVISGGLLRLGCCTLAMYEYFELSRV